MDRPRTATETSDVDLRVDRAWRDHRRHVLDVAFRMLGNLAEAEDVVQEGYARLVRADIDAIEDVGGWLVVVVSRLCLDRLRSGKRHPTGPDAMLGDRPAAGSTTLAGGPPVPLLADPADRVTLDDSVRLALHRVLERLTAAERTAFVLHDVFQYPFDAVAEVVGRTPAACRQLASRARRAIRDDGATARFVVEPAEQRRVTERFIAACARGDLDGLLAVLDPDVSGEGEVGGRAGRRVVHGAQEVAATLLFFLGPASPTTLLSLPIDGEPGVVALRRDRVAVVFRLTVAGDRVTHIDAIADPARLATLRAALGS
jgi:RNA polymerase sigma-70 factor (ECF subfamily)